MQPFEFYLQYLFLTNITKDYNAMDRTAEFANLLQTTGQSANVEFYNSELTQEERQSVASSFYSRAGVNGKGVFDLYEESLMYRPPSHNSDIEFQFHAENMNNESLNIATNKHDFTPHWKTMGFDAILRGECAVCILAGGQGSRLFTDSTTPKGCFVLPLLPSKRSLFQLFAEKIQCTEYMAMQHAEKIKWEDYPDVHIPVIILTSEENHEHTKKFFEDNQYFALEPEQVSFVPQAMLPVLHVSSMSDSDNSKSVPSFIFKSKSEIAFGPSGNGALFQALHQNGILEMLRSNGVRYMQMTTVDNPLNVMADPVFFGFCKSKVLEVGCKSFSMPCADIGKNVGIFAHESGKWSVCEYFEINDTLKDRAMQSQNTFALANMATYCLSIEFCFKALALLPGASKESGPTSTLPYHIAKKRIPCCRSSDGFTPGAKLESFIFDAFPFADRFGILVVDKAEEFAPIKTPDVQTGDAVDFQRVPEGTPLAARMAMLRIDLQRLPMQDPTSVEEFLWKLEAYEIENDPLLPFLSPKEMIQAEINDGVDMFAHSFE